MSKKYVLMSAGAMDWRIRGIYDSKKQVAEQTRKDWGLSEEECNEDNIDDVLDENECKLESGDYYPSKEVQRDEKLEKIGIK